MSVYFYSSHIINRPSFLFPTFLSLKLPSPTLKIYVTGPFCSDLSTVNSLLGFLCSLGFPYDTPTTPHNKTRPLIMFSDLRLSRISQAPCGSSTTRPHRPLLPLLLSSNLVFSRPIPELLGRSLRPNMRLTLSFVQNSSYHRTGLSVN